MAIHSHTWPCVHTDTHGHHLFFLSIKYLPSLPSSLLSFQYTSACTESQDGARVDITTWNFIRPLLLDLH